MKNFWFSLAGWLVIIAGLIWSLGNAHANILGEINRAAYFGTSLNLFEFLVGGILGSLTILVLFLAPGIFYLRVGMNKVRQNKLIQWSVGLTLFGLALIILSALVEAIFICPGLKCDLPIFTFIVGVIPAGILYGVSLVLLIINWFRR